MIYLYTNKPDEGCHKIHGVYGRPVHTHEQGKLMKAGWKRNPDELRKESEEAEEEVVLASPEVYEDLRAQYEELIGKKPHHKLKAETLQAKIDEALSND